MKDRIILGKQGFLEKTQDYFRGMFSMVDEDQPDGEWLQSHYDAAENNLDDACDAFNLKKPEGVDGYDITHYYMKKFGK